ncbi:hypothetical protein GCM10009828_063380 [Actinoplanes couchii]|uniref:DUF4145 domain-containing protein n=1 Tax=Actinoplanes couchii TaxID=403638 RepID=A0ABQ3X3G4_9ACTN|nr:hypothetical protein Aco03nite_014410 [Actinoplanes couchii]
MDNAAETLLRMSAQSYLAQADLYGDVVRTLQITPVVSDEGQALLQEYSHLVVSKTRRRKIDRDFGALTDYVFEQEDWPLGSEWATCIKVLHRYRNDAYHNDKVKTDVLDSAVAIYFYLVAHLLKHRKAVVWLIAAPSPGVLELLGVSELDRGPDPIQSGSSSHYGRLMADRLLRDFVPDHAGIAAALARHMQGRLGGIERDLKEIADFHDFPLRHPEFAIRLTQCTDDEWHSAGPPSDFWTREQDVTPSVFEEWRAAAADLAKIADALEALRTFAMQEEALASFEERAAALSLKVDHQIQQDIDFARGK